MYLITQERQLANIIRNQCDSEVYHAVVIMIIICGEREGGTATLLTTETKDGG